MSAQFNSSLLPPELAAILEDESPRDPGRQIYVNQDLNLAQIDVIGFDMDYTLAPYHQEAIDALSIKATVERMVDRKGYPEEIKQIPLDHDFIIRGLMVDKARGNIFKLDAHRQVGRCYHGYTAVPPAEVKALYGGRNFRFEPGRFAWIDTLFSLPEATLCAGIVEYYEGQGRPLPVASYEQLVNDIRESIDLAHADMSMKEVIMADIGRFIERDPDLAPTLHKLRSAGKRLFLLTNSEWVYTDAVMKFLLDGVMPRYPSWRNYFDLVVVSARKPRFFVLEEPFIELTADGEPIGPASSLERHKIYQGGNFKDMERMWGRGEGDQILYVGDHIYGDILRSKKDSSWRTALVIQEMEETLHLTNTLSSELTRLHALEEAVQRLDHEINYRATLLKSLSRVSDLAGGITGAESSALDRAMTQTRKELEQRRGLMQRTLEDLHTLESEVDARFNPYWGRLFRELNERSAFGQQVEEYADVYTSRVSNFLRYSPGQVFRAPRERMPHERV